MCLQVAERQERRHLESRAHTQHRFFVFFLFFFRWQNDKSGGTSNEVPTHNKETHYDFAGSVADGKLEARAVPEADFWQNQPGTNGKKKNTEKFSKVLVIVTFFDKYSGVLNLENLKIESGEF